MESPPSCSTWSEAFLLSDDSGLLMTSGSISSGSMSGESRSGRKFTTELLESDGEDKSLSQADSLDGMSDGGMCGENFNTLKKGPNWCDLSDPKQLISIDPPPEFQDSPLLPARNYNVQYPLPKWLDKFSSRLTATILDDALCACCKMTWSIPCSRECHAVMSSVVRPRAERTLKPRLCWTPELLPVSPCHIVSNRPNSRSSLSSSRLSSSHNSLSIPAALKVDDSSFITQAVSHDALAPGQICDIYNVPFDSDIYAVPVDTVRPPRTPPRRNKQQRCQRKRRRNVSAGSQSELARHIAQARQLTSKPRAVSHVIKSQAFLSDVCNTTTGKRHSVPGSSLPQPEAEPIHMTLQEVRQYLQTLYSSSSDSSDNKNKPDPPRHETIKVIGGSNTDVISNYETKVSRNSHRKHKKSSFVINIKNKKVKDSSESNKDCYTSETVKTAEKRRKSPVRTFSLNLKQTLCNLFRFRKVSSPGHVTTKREVVVKVKEVLEEEDESYVDNDGQKVPVQKRALPPLPADENPCKSEYNSDQADGKKTVEEDVGGELSMDFASSIEKVKDYGWYWGPISGEAAEKILSNEPDGSFIVRDSSDDHYIFSLTFKLNGCVRHVRIEHDQGNFSFGSCTKFKSHTIVEFIENAVEHSRSGRYLFFLHRRPVLGPMRVQLLHPVSRFKQVQSLQHMCRFVILKLVRRDLISQLPLPRRVIDYLSTPHYYSEQFLESEESSDSGAAPVTESNENGSDRNSASPRPHS